MNETLEFVARHGYWVLFFGVLCEQLGVPLPTVLILIAAGALAGAGQLNLILILALALAAASIGDAVWFFIGRRRGLQVLGFLCRVSLEPDSCVGGAKGVFLRHGARSLLVAKFIPGFTTFAPPLAGATGMSATRFFVFDGLGSLIWAGTFAALGYIFSDQIERVFAYAETFGWWFGAGILAIIFAYAGWKIFERQRLIRSLRVARILPGELKKLLDAGDDVLIVDLRSPLDFDANPQLIPTARRIPPAELEQLHTELPRDRDLVLYCTCPNEATSARTALRLHRRGLTRVRPLEGGFEKWGELGFPTNIHEAQKFTLKNSSNGTITQT